MTVTEPTIPTPPTSAADPGADDEAVDAFVERVFEAVLRAQEIQAIYLGDRLGWYEALAGGSRTAPELAEATGTDARYAREWLEHQTVAGYVTCEDPSAGPDDRRFTLPAAHAAALTDPESLAHVAPFARFVVGLGRRLDRVVEAFRSGEGVGWAEHGEDALEAQGAANRPMFLHRLGPEYLASIPEVDQRLRAGGRVADIGCGLAWSSIGVARAYPDATVDAYDVDEASVDRAREIVAEAGLSERITVRRAAAGSITTDRPYDVVMALECIHDLPDPVGVLTAMRSIAGDDGVVIVMDERVGDTFTGAPDDIEQFYYGFSLTCCLPDGRAHDHSVATGTVMRAPTLEGYARQAGFDGIEVLPVEDDFFRFYRLR